MAKDPPYLRMLVGVWTSSKAGLPITRNDADALEYRVSRLVIR